MTERLVGKKAPCFKMNAVSGDGENFTKVSLEDYKGKWLIMFFYPLDFTFVCPTEITAYSKRYEEFKKEGAEVLSVSTDSEYSHQAWINSSLGKLSFKMASDFTKEASRNYGVLVEEDGLALRGLFIIDPDSVVRYAVIHDLNVGRSVDETLRVLQALKSGGLCPIDWKPGEETL